VSAGKQLHWSAGGLRGLFTAGIDLVLENRGEASLINILGLLLLAKWALHG
jgi:hypothetical protein